MDARKVAITALVTLAGVGGIVTGALLLRKNTELREKAAVPGGRASVSLLPSSGSFNVGDSFPVSVYFNTDGIPVSVVAVRVTYSYTGASPAVVADNVTINPTISGSPDWSCPNSDVTQAAGKVNIDVECSNVSATGFSSTTDTLLATFNLDIESTPTTSPFTISFDQSLSKILQKSNGQDVLALPTSTGSYAVGGAGPTATLTPTGTITGTVTPTKKLTPTITKIPTTSTKSATVGTKLPDSGMTAPTVLGLGLGIIAIFAALALAL